MESGWGKGTGSCCRTQARCTASRRTARTPTRTRAAASRTRRAHRMYSAQRFLVLLPAAPMRPPSPPLLPAAAAARWASERPTLAAMAALGAGAARRATRLARAPPLARTEAARRSGHRCRAKCCYWRDRRARGRRRAARSGQSWRRRWPGWAPRSSSTTRAGTTPAPIRDVRTRVAIMEGGWVAATAARRQGRKATAQRTQRPMRARARCGRAARSSPACACACSRTTASRAQR